MRRQTALNKINACPPINIIVTGHGQSQMSTKFPIKIFVCFHKVYFSATHPSFSILTSPKLKPLTSGSRPGIFADLEVSGFFFKETFRSKETWWSLFIMWRTVCYHGELFMWLMDSVILASSKLCLLHLRTINHFQSLWTLLVSGCPCWTHSLTPSLE